MLPPENERAGLLAWRKKIDQRLKELDRQQAEEEDAMKWAMKDPRYVQWLQQQPRGRR